MLDELDNVKWENLACAHNPVEVPHLIRQLCSDDPDQRLQALEVLIEYLWYQGTVFECSLYALPFLVDLLTEPSTPDKTGIAVLISAIGTGTPYYTGQTSLEDPGIDWNAVLAKRGKSLDDELAKERVLADRIREEVKKALPHLIPYFEDPNSEVRIDIGEVLSRYPEYRDEHLRLLRNGLNIEPDPSTRERIQEYIDVLDSTWKKG
ncbi:MAG TPA: hypothetical protein VMP01_30075 [Pirellulaceae bacterium]|nr:hypothetical protein [Pirellulaceae bacterium]